MSLLPLSTVSVPHDFLNSYCCQIHPSPPYILMVLAPIMIEPPFENTKYKCRKAINNLRLIKVLWNIWNLMS